MVTAAYDADILIYCAAGDERGQMLSDALAGAPHDSAAGFGSVLLATEVLVIGQDRADEWRRLLAILSRLALIPVTQDIAVMGADLRRRHHLKTPDALHLATAIAAGAERFVTNNRRDFSAAISEIDIVHP